MSTPYCIGHDPVTVSTECCSVHSCGYNMNISKEYDLLEVLICYCRQAPAPLKANKKGMEKKQKHQQQGQHCADLINAYKKAIILLMFIVYFIPGRAISIGLGMPAP